MARALSSVPDAGAPTDSDPASALASPAAFEKHAHRVLSARCVAVADALLRETELSSPPRAPDPLLRPLARELLVGCLLRPLLGFCSPAWAHRGLAAMLAADDDFAAAGGEAREGDAPREGTEPTLLSARGGSAEVPETPETLFEEKEKKKDSEFSGRFLFQAAEKENRKALGRLYVFLYVGRGCRWMSGRGVLSFRGMVNVRIDRGAKGLMLVCKYCH